MRRPTSALADAGRRRSTRQADERAERDGTALAVTAESVSAAVDFDPDLAARIAADHEGGDWPVIPTAGRPRRRDPVGRRASRPRCCSCATRPASRTRPTSTPRCADCLAGVDALADDAGDGSRGERPDGVPPRAGVGRRRRPRRRAGRDRGRPVHLGRARRRQADRRDATPESALPGLTIPGPRELPQPRLPPGAARAHPARARDVLDLARADVRRRRAARPGLLLRAGPVDLPRDGRRRDHRAWASSTTCTTSPTARRTTTRTRWATRCSRPRREAGLRIALLDTCYLSSGLRRAAEGVQVRFSDGDADAWAARVDGLGRATTVADRRRDPLGPRRAARPARRASPRPPQGRPLHVHLSEQVAENDACLAAYGVTPDPAARRRRRARPLHHRRARHPPDRRRRRAARRGRRRTPASARPPSATSATASARAARLHDAGARLTLGSPTATP